MAQMDADVVAVPISARLTGIYERLHATYGDLTWHWSPEHAGDPMDVIAGAILVQHTAWENAERALDQMRAGGALSIEALLSLADDALLPLIRVSGTPTVKLRRLRAVAETLASAGGLQAFVALPLEELRPLLLATHGVGPETADAIALYACGKRTFEIDEYTRRIFRRIGIAPARDAYEAWRAMFEANLPGADVAMFQRYHAYIVLHGKMLCRPKPRCVACPLREDCATGRELTETGFE